MLEFAQRLVAISSVSGDERNVVDSCAEEMKSLGLAVEVDRAGNVLGIAGTGRPHLLFDAHADTVAASTDWTRDPLAADIADGRLYGLGALDIKGSLAAMIYGIADAVRTGGVPGTVGVSVSTCEEVIEGAALAHVVDRFAPDAAVIVEPSNGRMALAQRGRAELVIEIEGHGAHAAYPERGINALVAAAKIVAGLEARPVPHDDELGDGILVATEIRSEPYPGVSIVPSRSRLRLDRRLLPGESAELVIAELEPYLAPARALGAKATVRLSSFTVETYTGVALDGQRFFAAWRADREQPFLTAARALLSVGRPAAFCTNASETVARGIPTLILGAGDPGLAHQPDEYVEVADLESARAAYATLASLSFPVAGTKASSYRRLRP
jgi:putative selenium metabolism hydrolase